MQYTDEVTDFYELEKLVWSGAKDTMEYVREHDKEDELISYLEEIFYDNTPSLTEINDVLWFESDSIYEALGIQETTIEVSINNTEEGKPSYIDRTYSFIGNDLYKDDECLEENCKDDNETVTQIIIEKEKDNGTVMLIETDEGDIIYENEEDEEDEESEEE